LTYDHLNTNNNVNLYSLFSISVFVVNNCWLGLLTCKNRLPYNLYCVGGDVKHCSINRE